MNRKSRPIPVRESREDKKRVSKVLIRLNDGKMNDMGQPVYETIFQQTRRYFLGQGAGVSLGAMALAALRAESGFGAEFRGPPPALVASVQHLPAKVRSVIFLTQSGGPSQIELFDHKPDLIRWAGKELPDSIRQGQRLTTMTASQKQLIMPARTRFRKCGNSGATIGEWLPHLQNIADEVCFVKSMTTDQINHAPAMTKFLTGHQIPGRPSMGAWVSYGLGSENQNLPGFITINPQLSGDGGSPQHFGSAFLPAIYQGTVVASSAFLGAVAVTTSGSTRTQPCVQPTTQCSNGSRPITSMTSHGR